MNKAIKLLLWRCRDEIIFRTKENRTGGFYKLNDWIINADEQMVKELGLWCADVQEVNIKHRNS